MITIMTRFIFIEHVGAGVVGVRSSGGLRLGRYSEVLELKLTSNLASEGEEPEELQRLRLKPKLPLVS